MSDKTLRELEREAQTSITAANKLIHELKRLINEEWRVVVCAICKGIGSGGSRSALPDTPPEYLYPGSTYVYFNCWKCAGYGHVRVSLTMLPEQTQYNPLVPLDYKYD